MGCFISYAEIEIERLRNDYEKACGIIAEMHAAATKGATGLRRGFVEDITDIRTELNKLRAFWEWSRPTEKMKFEEEYENGVRRLK